MDDCTALSPGAALDSIARGSHLAPIRMTRRCGGSADSLVGHSHGRRSLMADDNDDIDVHSGEILGVARGPIVQTEEDKDFVRDSKDFVRDSDVSSGSTGHSDEEIRSERTTTQTPYGVPKPPDGLHIED
jgi:hypothetical protein